MTLTLLASLITVSAGCDSKSLTVILAGTLLNLYILNGTLESTIYICGLTLDLFVFSLFLYRSFVFLSDGFDLSFVTGWEVRLVRVDPVFALQFVGEVVRV